MDSRSSLSETYATLALCSPCLNHPRVHIPVLLQRLLERDEPRGVRSTDTWPAVLDRLAVEVVSIYARENQLSKTDHLL